MADTNPTALGMIDLRISADGESFEKAEISFSRAIERAIEKAGSKLTKQAGTVGGKLVEGKEGRGTGIGGAVTGGAVGARLAGAAASKIPGARGLVAAGGRAAKAAGPFAPLVIGAVLVGAALIGLAVGAKKITTKLLAEGDRLRGLSGSLAQAGAIKQVGQLIRDINRARTLGPAILSITRSTEAIKNALAPIVDTLLLAFARALEGIVEIAVQVINTGLILVQTFDLVNKAFDFLAGFAGGSGNFGLMVTVTAIKELITNAAREARQARDEAAGVEGINRIFLEQLATLIGGPNQVLGGPNELIPGAFPTGP